VGLLLDESSAQDRDWVNSLLAGPQLAAFADIAPDYAVEAVVRSLLTLRGLQDATTGLMVASPLTSVPQWRGGERSWDYRYAWLRDCADGGLALVRAGATEEASSLAQGLAARLEADPGRIAPVRRLDGGPLPAEHRLGHLSGYEGAPVRIGNAAAAQAQVDTLGEVVRFVEALDRLGGCPKPLRDLVPELANHAATDWRLPDHGIWEVRGAKRDYVHSKLLAWSALDSAVRLAAKGRIAATDAAAWSQASTALEAAIAARGTGSEGELRMAFDDHSADSSTLAAYVVGYIGKAPGAEATLDHVLRHLQDGFLLARYRPERDGIPGPSAPFIFPSLWAVIAESKLGRREAAIDRLAAILSLAGPAGQLSEVADPHSLTMLGNYPQVQSHAALIETVLELWPPSNHP
jgi:GH15 family glucan-1,4-alpha-glucosidase